MTAGGLGLQNALVYEGAYYAAFLELEKARKVPVEAPSGSWQVGYNEWTTFYNIPYIITPQQPEKTPTMEALTQDFIARGAELTSGRQKTLSFYWQWVLSIFGPQILAHFGTFRFLIEELVPLQLISQQRQDDTSLT
jgi:hypothetical protein